MKEDSNRTHGSTNTAGCVILALCTLAGALVALALYAGRLAPTLTQLPTMPKAAVQILSIDRAGFFQSTPYVLTEDGALYTYAWDGRQYQWERAVSPAAASAPDPCEPATRRHMEEKAGSLTECYTVRTYGENHPGPIVSFGIDGNGDVWQLSQPQVSWLFLAISVFFAAAIGCTVGVAIFVVHQAVRRHVRSLPGSSIIPSKR
jgi:hypothetical protein